MSQESVTPVRPEIPFAPLTDPSLHDPDYPAKTFRVDLAKVEHDFPLTRAERAALIPANILALNQEEVDQLYARLTAGPIPDGPYLGDLFFSRGETLRRGSRRSSAASRAASPPRRSSSPRAPAARSGRARCSTATSGSSGTSSRTSMTCAS